MEVGYSPINGEEFKRRVLDDVRVYLGNDTRFKRSIAYHRLHCTIQLKFEAFGLPEDKVTIHSETTARTLEAENKNLMDKLESAEKKWTERLSRLSTEYAAREKALEEELLGLQAQNNSLKDELRGKTPSVREEKKAPENGAVAEFSITIEQPTVEEPGRVRKELEASEEKVGRDPSEARNVNTQGQPVAPPQPANRGAVVGGGQRPQNVVGKPR